MTKKLRYMLFAGYNLKDYQQGGLMQWSHAFEKYGAKGDTQPNLTKEILENYDIVAVNYVAKNASYLAAMREALGKSSSTKIVCNVDFAMLMWSKMDPYVLKKMLADADMVFHVEPYGAERIHSLTGIDVAVLPHPVDTELVKAFRIEGAVKPPVVWSCQYHRYFNTWCDYFYATQELKKEYDARTVLMNLTVTEENKMPFNSYFDEIIESMQYEQYLQLLARSWLNMDTTPDYTYGRGVVDAAVLGVPTITDCNCYAGRIIWPALQVNYGDDRSVRERIKYVMDTDGVLETEAKAGIQRAEIFGLKTSYDRMVAELEARELV